ncbi:MAG TPA: YebC/PmpR family DNA-binding transcriptional regulator [Bacteroidia bacterium]|nr:YebC/PmpR family DNA-binding transcriptional regulator [Bacteroidia bacterium]
MGRAFEKRKHKMFARFEKMAKTFTRIGREIAIAVKKNGPDPDGNPRLRMVMQNAKNVNMPKERVEAAIKKASSVDEKDYEEIVYEGYAPGGIALLVECATNNPTRTVANLRMHFSRHEGELGKSGSVEYLFERKGVFKISAENRNVEELELELIDYGADEVYEEEGSIYVYTSFADYGKMQKALEDKNIPIVSAELQRITLNPVDVSDNTEASVHKLIETLEEDDDVQNIFHNMK